MARLSYREALNQAMPSARSAETTMTISEANEVSPWRG